MKIAILVSMIGSSCAFVPSVNPKGTSFLTAQNDANEITDSVLLSEGAIYFSCCYTELQLEFLIYPSLVLSS